MFRKPKMENEGAPTTAPGPEVPENPESTIPVIGPDEKNEDDSAEFDSASAECLIGIEQLLGDISTGVAALESMQTYGLNAGMASIMAVQNMQTAAIPSVESLAIFPLEVGSPELGVAVEGVIDSIKEKIVNFAKRAWELVEKAGNAAKKGVAKVIDGVKSALSWVKTKTFNAAAATKATIKAHPFASMAIAAAGVGLASAAIVGIWGPALSGGLANWGERAASYITKVKLPTGKYVLNQETGAMQFIKNADGEITGTAAKLGYSAKDKISGLLSELSKHLSTAWKAIGDFMRGIPGHLKSLGSSADKAVSPKVTSVIGAFKRALSWTWELIRNGIVGAASWVMRGIKHISSVVFKTGAGDDISHVAVLGSENLLGSFL